MIVSVVAMVVAGLLLWRRDFDKAFAAAALGMAAWFLSYRVQMKAVVTAADLEDNQRYKERVDEEFDDE
jgi:dipeptide/tripeptide permease